jgi:hypothetical protein
MSGQFSRVILQRFRFAAASLAILVGLWAASDVHQHQTGLHTPIQCSICALENAVAGGCFPAHVWIPEVAAAEVAVEPAEPRLLPVALPASATIRAPPVIS